MSNYIMDYDWLTQVQLDDKVARIVVTVDVPDSYEHFESWGYADDLQWDSVVAER